MSLIGLLSFCRSERQKCWSSCYRQWNFNLILCVFIWCPCLHWQLITTGHLVTVQICWPQSTLWKIFPFCSESKVKGRYTAAVLFQESHFDTKRGSCAVKKLPPVFCFFLLIKADLAKVPRCADEHKLPVTKSVWSRCVTRLPRRQGQRRRPTGSLSGPVSDETRWTKPDAKNSNEPKDNTLHSSPSPLRFSPIICT